MIYEKYVKENPYFQRKQENPNTELIRCIVETYEELVNANKNYEFAEGDLVDYYLYQIKAIQSKYNYLIKKAKKSGLFANMYDILKIKELSDVI